MLLGGAFSGAPGGGPASWQLLRCLPEGPFRTKNATALESGICTALLWPSFFCTVFSAYFPWENKHFWAVSVALSYLRAEFYCPCRIYSLNFRGPRMGGWIRRVWISSFWGAPIFRAEVPKPFNTIILEPLD